MAKKKERKIFNIDEVNIEIDYDKLAEAIVKANETQTNQYSMSREWMKFIIYPVLWGVAIVTGILAIFFLVYGGKELVEIMTIANVGDVDFLNLFSGFWANASTGFLVFCMGLFLISISLATIFTAKEIDKETDRDYVASMFSNVVALVALVVSLVALVKG